ncbi:hypothetical protein [Hymenobacter psychrotolerans]|uniref:Uncharacterized protein n=1 Tax=Hymenobacter psychrotolerans DSM 18569 TaxID=1121959 RepID=A0A1M6Z6V6_9BACT|nr:hypothetical protein [Hymenobacter psychrotolerans]SHL26122.1 hypothetical protein SAMN02746009_02439 [Hymenobacter psychrotolerans DSM 18569]
MSQPTLVLAPAHEAASLIARFALRSPVPAPALEELHELLQHYPPRRIAQCLAEAHSQLVVQEAGPGTRRQQAAYQALLLALLDLADLTDVALPQPVTLAA